MRSRRFIILLSLSVLFVVSQSGAFAASINLKVASYLPPPQHTSKVMEEFIADLASRTSGQVESKWFPGGSLANAPAMIKAIEMGITDIGLSHCSYTPGRFPVTEVCELPHGFPTGYVACLVMNDFYNKFQPKEWEKVHPLFFHANTPSVLAGTKPLKTMEDFKGQIIRAPGRMAEIIAALGGTPAPTPIMETYDAISKGVINGVFVGGEGLAAFRFAEVVKYVTNSWNIGSSYTFYVAMNKRAYEKLPGNVKKILDELSQEYIEKMAVAWNNADFRGKKACEEKGVEWYELPADEFQRWIDAQKPVFDNYKKEMMGKGYSEAEIQSWIDYLAERKDVQLKKQISIGLKSTTGPPSVQK